mgnify:FL=1
MSDSVFVGTQIDPSVRDAAIRALDMSGLSLSDAIRLMIAKTARDNRLPFDADAALEEEYGEEIPNALTRETIEKAERGEDVFYAKDFDDLLAQLRS